MPAKSVQALLEDIRLVSEERHEVVEAVRSVVRRTVKSYAEEVKYGGILFSSAGIQFGGVFAYKEHVTVEFSKGAAISDPHAHLEGTGKGRRHIKLRSTNDIRAKNLAQYVTLALQAAEREA